MSISLNKNTITINGEIYPTDGQGNREEIEIDGYRFVIEGANKITILVDGDVDSITTGCANVDVSGDVGSVDIGVGDARIGGYVDGDVSVSTGDIEVNGDVSGDVVNSMGNIEVVGSVEGDATTSMGDVIIRNR